jgi:hypothetical protein
MLAFTNRKKVQDQLATSDEIEGSCAGYQWTADGIQTFQSSEYFASLSVPPVEGSVLTKEQYNQMDTATDVFAL